MGSQKSHGKALENPKLEAKGCFYTGNMSYLTDAQNFYSLHINEESGNDGQLITDWNNVYWASNLLLANLTGTGAYHDAVQVMLCFGMKILYTDL